MSPWDHMIKLQILARIFSMNNKEHTKGSMTFTFMTMLLRNSLLVKERCPTYLERLNSRSKNTRLRFQSGQEIMIPGAKTSIRNLKGNQSSSTLFFGECIGGSVEETHWGWKEVVLSSTVLQPQVPYMSLCCLGQLHVLLSSYSLVGSMGDIFPRNAYLSHTDV